MFSGEAANTNFILFGLTWPGIELMIYHTSGLCKWNAYYARNYIMKLNREVIMISDAKFSDQDFAWVNQNKLNCMSAYSI
jgi:hypothetical protein